MWVSHGGLCDKEINCTLRNKVIFGKFWKFSLAIVQLRDFEYNFLVKTPILVILALTDPLFLGVLSI